MTRRLLDICIVTADFVGPIRNGGIGTAYYNLALSLRDAGHRVTVLYTLGTYTETRNVAYWRDYYRARKIDFVPMPRTGLDGHGALRMAYGAYQWIKGRHFDVVHCHEWRAVGFCIALAKRQGLCLQDALLCVGTHSPTMWCLEGMHEVADAEALEVDHMERQSVALADVLWTPSAHMRDWMTREGWTLPSRVLLQPNLLDEADLEKAASAKPGPELVFFGRLETRKGIDLFCDALDRLQARGTPPHLVTFLGKTSHVAGTSSEDYLEARAKRWNFRWTAITTLDRTGAMAYLRGKNRIAVLPSLLDNVPYTVLECLGSNIPFIASDVGGIPEMIRPGDRKRVLFELTVASLATRLEEVMAKGLQPARMRVEPSVVRDRWLRWHSKTAGRKSTRTVLPRRSKQRLPLVSACVTTRNRPDYLRAAVASLNAQDYDRLEIIVVDDGSDRKDAVDALTTLEAEFSRTRLRVVRQQNRYVGAARNAAVAEARGDYLLFMDDDNLAEPHEVSTFVRAARHSGADILTCFMRVFRSNRATPRGSSSRVWPFLGGALAAGLLRNTFGDANAFYRRDVFDRIGMFTEDFGVGAEDWEYFARAVLRGALLQVVPEPLVRYRQSPNGMLHTTSQRRNQMRAMRPYLQLLPPQLRGLAHLARTSGVSHALPPAVRFDHVRHAAIFGCGEGGRLALGLAERFGWKVPYLVDNNPAMWTRTAFGRPVVAPATLSKSPVDLVIVASLAGKPAISAQLEHMGLVSGEHFVHFLDPMRAGNFVAQIQL